MQWFKGRSSFIIGSDKWMGGQKSDSIAAFERSNSLPSPAPPEGVTREVNGIPSSAKDEVAQYDPTTGLKVRSPTRDENLDKVAGATSKLYPDIYQPPSSKGAETSDAKEPPVVEASEEVLVKIPGCLAHLIDEQESVILASGEFVLVKLLQNGTDVALFARVGDELQWPVVNDLPATKLDPSHYVFSLRVEADDDEKPPKDSKATETLNYGVTFQVDGNKELLRELDKILEQYSYFSAPTMLQGSEEDVKKVDGGKVPEASSREVVSSDLPGKPVPTDAITEKKPSDEVSTAYWTTIAPNVDDYNSSLARAIAGGTGHIIRGIFWCSETTVANLERTGRLVRRVSGACGKPSEVSPRTMRNIRRAKRVTKMSEKVAKGVLTGVVSVTGFFTTSIVNSRAGKKFFKMLPGEIALASLDGFGKIFDAVEVAGTNVLNTSSVVTTGAISHRFGDKAGEFAHEGLATAGHLVSTAWTISKLRNAINPKSVMKPTSVLKTAAKAASQGIEPKR
ncbi:senescence/dehydration-associated protein At4g35985, chloroplastic isoform X2 [Selaginella moellendorffii]|nr:senescence/dehydration-associated protein At4g35985, chloroplastic isoform X2 [Selaginella moellendorffii]|eukprot:XP_024539967.1 senescence/dehydration-associated protein At4g35985, chloroplastic isoform X2 [Selaginella moellendorffii]